MKKDYKNIIIIVIISLLVMLPLLTETHTYGHDTKFHAANIASISETINSNIIPSSILKNVGNNFGYGTHIFYPSLPHVVGAYTLSIASNFGFDSYDTMTFIYLIITILSGITIYYLSKHISKCNSISLISALIFLTFPYRLGDIIVRSAFNEVFLFLFIPLVLLSLFELIDKNYKRFNILFIIGTLGMIYSHLVLTIYFIIFIIPFLIIYRKEILNKETISKMIKPVVIVFIPSLPMLIPLLEHKVLGNYMVFKDDYMSNITYLDIYNNKIQDYLIIGKDYSWEVPFFINWIVIILSIVSIGYVLLKNREKKYIYLVLLFFIPFIMSLNIFPWKYLPEFLYMIQFSWRMETFIVIALSLLAPVCLNLVKKENIYNLVTGITCIIIVLSSIPLINSLSSHTYVVEKTIDYNDGMGWSREYLPENTYIHSGYIGERSEDIVILRGNAKITILKNDVPNLKFKVSNNDSEIKIELPRFYYIGYSLKDSNNKKIKVIENENGFLEAVIKGNGTYTLKYTGSILTRISKYLSIITIIYLGYDSIIKEKIKRKRIN